MRRLVLLAPSLLFASLALAADAPTASPASPVAPGGSAFVAEGKIGTVADIEAFGDEFWNARFDLTKAAKVDHLVVTKDAAKWTLTGYVFLKAPVRGIASRARFYGEGRFELTPPIDMEKQQIRRFLGTESIDQPIDQARFDFNGANEQQVFETLVYTTEAASEARAKNDKAREWMEELEKLYSKPQSAESEAQRRQQEYLGSIRIYQRLMEPSLEGFMDVSMDVAKAPGSDKPKTTLVGLRFGYDPDEDEEVGVAGQFDHGDDKLWSTLTSFACCGKYAGDLEWAATSPLLEAQSKEKIGMVKDTLRITFDPGGRSDISMASTMDLVVRADTVPMLAFYITPYMGTKKCRIDGKDAGFVQPEIPGVADLHVPGILVPLPRPYKKGEHLTVELDMEGRILKDLDGSTWVVKEEDAWFPHLNGPSIRETSALFDTTLIVPKGFTAISNGAEAPCEGDIGAGNDCFHYVMNVGIDLPMFNIGRDMKVDKGNAVDGTPIAVFTCKEAKREFEYFNPDNPNLVERRSYSMSDTGASIVNLAKLAHKTYEDWFGDDPYNRLYLTPHVKGHGRGSASLLLLYQGAFLSSTNEAEWTTLSGGVYQPWRSPAFISHEIAHQWWGGRSGIRGDRDQWFSEGFADYGCNIVMENYDIVNHTNWKQSQLAEWIGYLTKDDGYVHTVAPLALGNRFDSPENRRGYEYYRQNFMYSKGALVMQMLRTVARAKEGDKNKGDELFRKAIHDFMDWCSGRHPSNYDLMTHFSQSYGMRLDWFFKQWVYGLGIPKVEFSYQVVPAADGKGWMLRGHVKQKDTAFIFPVSVSLHQKGEKGDVPYFYQWVQKSDDTFEKGPIPFMPDKVTLNEDNGLLAIITPVSWQ